MYFDERFKELIKKQGKTFAETQELLDRHNELPAIKKTMNGTPLSEALESYLIELLIYLSRVNGEVDFREIEFVKILLQKNLSKEAIRQSGANAVEIDLHNSDLFALIYQIDRELAEALINTIEAIGLIFIAVDGHSDIPEIKALTNIIFEIRYEIRSLGNMPNTIPGTKSTIDTVDTNETNNTNDAAGEPEQDLESILSELNELIGLESIKEEIAGLINLIKVRKLREEKDLPILPMSFHLVFSGNPGTGKTTVARIVSKIYKNLGVISKGNLVEVDRSGLVAGFVGQTAIKTREVIDSAKGGVLFIDEAYSLTPGSSQSDYGSEAIEVLLKAMEDQRGDLVVIVAGYTNEMEDFLNSNPGLKSRFNKFIHFSDYTPEELLDIFILISKKHGYRLTDDAKEELEKLISQVYDNRTENFANARITRNMFESVIQYQANRVIEIEEPSRDELQEITIEDIKMLENEYIRQ
ncbi:MAG: AAA family ATPase [Campylobacterota bacterium]|nr:AAA family ATPase [Campylobacterota bacterium]